MTENEKNNILFKRKLIKLGNSKAITLSEEMLEFLGNPEELTLMPDEGKHGRFIAIFKKDD